MDKKRGSRENNQSIRSTPKSSYACFLSAVPSFERITSIRCARVWEASGQYTLNFGEGRKD